MKKLTTLAAVAVLAGTSYAQLSPLPPSSTTDGVSIQPIGLNAGATHWDSTSSIGAFKVVSTTDGTAPITNIAYNPIGLTFSTSMPTAVQTNLNTLNSSGGIIRTIFLAESAGWTDSLGYTRSGTPGGAQSYTVFNQMEMNPASGNPVNVHYGDYFDVSLAAGAASNFDLWFQGDGLASAAGVYTPFHPANSSNTVSPGNVMWAQQTVTANTWIASLGAYMDVTTYILGFEDWRLDRDSDHDYSDGVFALQFFTNSGTPFTPVPEPSTYGLVGAVALLGLAALRRVTRKKRNRGGLIEPTALAY